MRVSSAEGIVMEALWRKNPLSAEGVAADVAADLAPESRVKFVEITKCFFEADDLDAHGLSWFDSTSNRTISSTIIGGVSSRSRGLMPVRMAS